MAFILKRWGSFTCAIQPGTPHCGPDEQLLREFRYVVTCKAGDDALDNHGFLIDNMTISAYFEQKYGNPNDPVTMSCEMLAKESAFGIRGLIPKISDCEEIDVEIFPFEGASVTYHWSNPQRNDPENDEDAKPVDLDSTANNGGDQNQYAHNGAGF